MHAHIPNAGGATQLGVLANAIGDALAGLAARLDVDGPAAAQVARVRLDGLTVLWRTYEVLAGNLEQAAAEAIAAIARLEGSGEITRAAADALMAPYEDALGSMYVDAMAAQ